MADFVAVCNIIGLLLCECKNFVLMHC
jgi:hypothetical protein